MVLAQEDERTHPYWYARVIRIFHVNVEYRENEESHYSRPRHMDVLFVRWFQRDGSPTAFTAKCLQQLELFDQDSLGEAFGFLDPDSVIRGVHIIPAFAYSHTDTLLGPSFVRKEEELDTDWRYYYVNITYYRFIDRDIFMRFHGGGIGHKAMREWDEFLQGGETESGAQEDSEMRGDESDLEDEGDMEDLEEEGTDEDEEGTDEDKEGSDTDVGQDNDDDRVLADEGEELDDDLFAEEGYGAL
ncbi:hypothetical protein DFJ58DRAFT_660000 [Suillus subalutaceus]|uniref:uncharacterized protein n=1 Tax=Suillus subalutaceus TaxID=48586 RepID=UPI001B8614BB|nr:uncharacterized protein DFJ58DRAFT_660000 [Suillus subalutaceus]KAG1855212.1 hypothetical protein DFJ58DRAFT_660000 [Suillus subalutaceus]